MNVTYPLELIQLVDQMWDLLIKVTMDITVVAT